MKIGHEEEVVMFPFHKRKVKTISMKPPIFGEFYLKMHQLQVEDMPNLPRLFYSCLLSDLAFEWQRSWKLPCFDTDLTAFVV